MVDINSNKEFFIKELYLCFQKLVSGELHTFIFGRFPCPGIEPGSLESGCYFMFVIFILGHLKCNNCQVIFSTKFQQTGTFHFRGKSVKNDHYFPFCSNVELCLWPLTPWI